MRSPRLYLIIVGAWILSSAFAVPPMIHVTEAAWRHSIAAGLLVGLCCLFILVFWLNGMKDVVYSLYYHLWMKRHEVLVSHHELSREPRVVMVYCTYNDFQGASLLASMAQNYENYTTVILDDSDRPEAVEDVDAFAAQHGIEVVRRPNRTGFKAGNLNNYLLFDAGYEYFVVLDSDEIVPPNFIRRCLDHFAADERVAIVQANHIATRNKNSFMQKFALGVDSHWVTYQTVKARYGFLSLLGHGAMVKREPFIKVGGFPNLVSEDLCLAVEMRDQGYFVSFAPEVICQEEFPVDYSAFKKRHKKWTQGNMEFIRRYTWRIFRSRMHWYEKLDIGLFTYALPLTAVFSLFILIQVVILPQMGVLVRFPLWMLIPTVVYLLAPMLNDIISNWRLPKRRLLSYCVHSILLYGSMYFVSLRGSLASLFTGAVFVVTPKEHQARRVSSWDSLYANRIEVACGLAVAGVAAWSVTSVFPVLLLITPAFFTPYLGILHNHGVDKTVAQELVLD